MNRPAESSSDSDEEMLDIRLNVDKNIGFAQDNLENANNVEDDVMVDETCPSNVFHKTQINIEITPNPNFMQPSLDLLSEGGLVLNQNAFSLQLPIHDVLSKLNNHMVKGILYREEFISGITAWISQKDDHILQALSELTYEDQRTGESLCRIILRNQHLQIYMMRFLFNLVEDNVEMLGENHASIAYSRNIPLRILDSLKWLDEIYDFDRMQILLEDCLNSWEPYALLQLIQRIPDIISDKLHKSISIRLIELYKENNEGPEVRAALLTCLSDLHIDSDVLTNLIDYIGKEILPTELVHHLPKTLDFLLLNTDEKQIDTMISEMMEHLAVETLCELSLKNSQSDLRMGETLCLESIHRGLNFRPSLQDSFLRVLSQYEGKFTVIRLWILIILFSYQKRRSACLRIFRHKISSGLISKSLVQKSIANHKEALSPHLSAWKTIGTLLLEEKNFEISNIGSELFYQLLINFPEESLGFLNALTRSLGSDSNIEKTMALKILHRVVNTPQVNIEISAFNFFFKNSLKWIEDLTITQTRLIYQIFCHLTYQLNFTGIQSELENQMRKQLQQTPMRWKRLGMIGITCRIMSSGCFDGDENSGNIPQQSLSLDEFSQIDKLLNDAFNFCQSPHAMTYLFEELAFVAKRIRMDERVLSIIEEQCECVLDEILFRWNDADGDIQDQQNRLKEYQRVQSTLPIQKCLLRFDDKQFLNIIQPIVSEDVHDFGRFLQIYSSLRLFSSVSNKKGFQPSLIILDSEEEDFHIASRRYKDVLIHCLLCELNFYREQINIWTSNNEGDVYLEEIFLRIEKNLKILDKVLFHSPNFRVRRALATIFQTLNDESNLKIGKKRISKDQTTGKTKLYKDLGICNLKYTKKISPYLRELDLGSVDYLKSISEVDKSSTKPYFGYYYLLRDVKHKLSALTMSKKTEHVSDSNLLSNNNIDDYIDFLSGKGKYFVRLFELTLDDILKNDEDLNLSAAFAVVGTFCDIMRICLAHFQGNSNVEGMKNFLCIVFSLEDDSQLFEDVLEFFTQTLLFNAFQNNSQILIPGFKLLYCFGEITKNMDHKVKCSDFAFRILKEVTIEGDLSKSVYLKIFEPVTSTFVNLSRNYMNSVEHLCKCLIEFVEHDKTELESLRRENVDVLYQIAFQKLADRFADIPKFDRNFPQSKFRKSFREIEKIATIFNQLCEIAKKSPLKVPKGMKYDLVKCALRGAKPVLQKFNENGSKYLRSILKFKKIEEDPIRNCLQQFRTAASSLTYLANEAKSLGLHQPLIPEITKQISLLSSKTKIIFSNSDFEVTGETVLESTERYSHLFVEEDQENSSEMSDSNSDSSNEIQTESNSDPMHDEPARKIRKLEDTDSFI